jgi:hypothetical protein
VRTCMNLQCILWGVNATAVNILNYRCLTDVRTAHEPSEGHYDALYGCETWSLIKGMAY